MILRLISTTVLTLVLSADPGSLGAQSADRPPASPQSEFVRPGDLVKLTVWREPELTGEFPVDRNGIVMIPKIGPYDVTAETPESLQARIMQALSPYLRDPVIEVVVLRRVKVLGAVERPGLFNVDPTMTLGDALALAGGATLTGRRDRIQLLRDGEVIPADLTEDMQVADTPIRSGDEIFVPEKSWFVRNAGTLISAGTATLGVIVALVFR